MARHRNVRTMKYEDEFFDDDDVEDCYGQSFDDKYCISPGTAAQFTFSRGSNFDLGSYISGESSPAIPSQVPEIITPKSQTAKVTQKTHNFSDLDEARLNSCLDQVHEVIADLHPREVVVNCIKKHNFNSEAVLNELLSSPDAPKPQRQPRQGRRVQEFPSDLYAQFGTPSSEYDDEEDNDDYGRDVSKCSLIVVVPHHKCYQEYNSVGEEECSSYSSHNSGDTEDQVYFLSEQNGNSPGLNKMQIMRHLKSDSTSSENVAPSTESSDDNDLEVDTELQSIGDDDAGVEQICFPDNNESLMCKSKESSEQNITLNNHEGSLPNNRCNDMRLNSVKTIAALSASKFPTPKSDKYELLKLFAMANINKQKMEESASLVSTNNDDLSTSPQASLCEKISQSPLQNQSNLKANYHSKGLPLAKENSFKSSLADIFQQRHKSPNNNNSQGYIIEKCEECSANQSNFKKTCNTMSLADLAKQRIGSNLNEQLSAIGGSLSRITSPCPNKQKKLPLTNSSSKPLIDLTNHCFGKCFNFSDQNDKRFDGFQSLNSAKESSNKESGEKLIPPDKATLVDLTKQHLCSGISSFQSHNNFSLKDLCKIGLEDTSQVIGKKSSDVDSSKISTNVDINESEHSFSKAHLDNQKKNYATELTNSKNSDFTISYNSPKNDCQPMSLGELFSQVNNSKIDFNSDNMNTLEDLWKGPSSKHKTEQQQPNQSKEKDMETIEKSSLLSSFLNEASSDYHNLKTIYEASASLFGRVVSYHPKTVKCTEKITSKNKYHKFSYRTQMCGRNSNQETKLAQIVPFDFSTPSPDDIVKKYQSQAFCHKNTITLD